MTAFQKGMSLIDSPQVRGRILRNTERMVQLAEQHLEEPAEGTEEGEA